MHLTLFLLCLWANGDGGAVMVPCDASEFIETTVSEFTFIGLGNVDAFDGYFL